MRLSGLLGGALAGGAKAYSGHLIEQDREASREKERTATVKSQEDLMRLRVELEQQAADKADARKIATAKQQGSEISTASQGLLSANVEQRAQAVQGANPAAAEFIRKEMGASEMETETANRDAARGLGFSAQEKEANDRLKDMSTAEYQKSQDKLNHGRLDQQIKNQDERNKILDKQVQAQISASNRASDKQGAATEYQQRKLQYDTLKTDLDQARKALEDVSSSLEADPEKIARAQQAFDASSANFKQFSLEIGAVKKVYPAPTPEATDYLIKNPQLKAQFEEMYGADALKRALPYKITNKPSKINGR